MVWLGLREILWLRLVWFERDALVWFGLREMLYLVWSERDAMVWSGLREMLGFGLRELCFDLIWPG